jgi:hypothetical protein
MDAEAAPQRLLSKTENVSRIGRTFDSMQKYYLSHRCMQWLVFDYNDCVSIVYSVLLAKWREASFIDLSGPEISGNRKKMRIRKDRLKRPQTSV